MKPKKLWTLDDVKDAELRKDYSGIIGKKYESLQRMKSNSRNMEELITSENFIVERVLKAYLDSEKRKEYLKETPTPGEGKISAIPEYMLLVKPERNIPVENLHFIGMLKVEENDLIKAKMPVYLRHSVDIHTYPFYTGIPETLYFPRDFTNEEKAIEIQILSRNTGKPEKEFRSADYHQYIKAR